MQRFRTTDLDYLEILPASSNALKERVQNILNQSLSYSAAIASMDSQTGTYKIVLQGTLPEVSLMHQNAA
ncbi:MAG: hypothetical protein ACE5I1_03785 [bacterium]